MGDARAAVAELGWTAAFRTGGLQTPIPGEQAPGSWCVYDATPTCDEESAMMVVLFVGEGETAPPLPPFPSGAPTPVPAD